MNEENELVNCPHCGQPTPRENLNCIYCGELLGEPVGLLSGLLRGWKGIAGIVLVALIIIVFLVLIL